MKHWLVAVAAIGATACTTQMETRPSGNGVHGVVGAPYALPVVHHDLTVTRTLVGCKLAPDGTIEKLEFEAKVEHAPRFVAGERYVIDYSALGNWHKTSGFKISTFPNQTLKGVNSEADDRSPEIIGATVKTVLTAARIVSGMPGGSVARAPTQVTATEAQRLLGALKHNALASDMSKLRELIADATLPALPQCPSEVASMKQASDALDDKTAELSKLTRKLDAIVVPALIGLATEEQKQEVAALRKKILEVTDQQAAVQRQYDTYAEKVRFVETVTFTPQSGKTDNSHEFAFPGGKTEAMQTQRLRAMFDINDTVLPKELVKLLRESATVSASLILDAEPKPKPNPVPGSVTAPPSVCEQANLQAKDCESPEMPEWGNGKPRAIPGIAFRNPVQARLRVCKALTAPECTYGTTQPMLLDTTVSVPQLGRLTILPFRNGFGANNRVEAVFREDGSLDWLSYDVKEASGENLANMLGDGADQYLAYRKERREQEKAELAETAAAPGKALDEQIAMLKKQQELAQLEAAKAPATVSQQQELTRLEAEVARLTALKQIKELDAALKKQDDA